MVSVSPGQPKAEPGWGPDESEIQSYGMEAWQVSAWYHRQQPHCHAICQHAHCMPTKHTTAQKYNTSRTVQAHTMAHHMAYPAGGDKVAGGQAPHMLLPSHIPAWGQLPSRDSGMVDSPRSLYPKACIIPSSVMGQGGAACNGACSSPLGPRDPQLGQWGAERR